MRLREWQTGKLAFGQVIDTPYFHQRYHGSSGSGYFLKLSVLLEDKQYTVKAWHLASPNFPPVEEGDYMLLEYTPSAKRVTQYRAWNLKSPDHLQSWRLGYVRCDFTERQCYVRITCPTLTGEPPLSIKADANGIDREHLTRGVPVLVEAYDPNDARKYRVLRAWSGRARVAFDQERYPGKPTFSKIIPVQGERQGPIKNCSRKETDMSTMSKDRVRFTIPHRRINSKMIDVIHKAFGFDAHWSAEQAQENGRGLNITCRPSQFARFLIYRDEAGQQNLFQELGAELFVPKAADPLSEFASEHGVSRTVVLDLLTALGIDPESVKKRLCGKGDGPVEIDVSQVPRQG